MNVYILKAPPAATGDNFRYWRPPQLLYIPHGTDGGVRLLTGGGLLTDGEFVYMVVSEDLSQLGWCFCVGSGSPAPAQHGGCLPLQRLRNYPIELPREPVGVMGQLVHFSREQGYGLVRMSEDWFQGGKERIIQEAIPIDHINEHVDEAQMMDCVEFATASGEVVTGVVAATHSYCVLDANGRRRRAQAFLVNTSSYTVLPEDCGIWVRRSIASEKPLLLGHVVGFSEFSSCGLLVLPFSMFKDDLKDKIRGAAAR